MRRSQPLDVTERRRVDILVGTEQEKIGDRRIVQIARHRRMQPNAVERVADYNSPPELRVVEGL